jgi:hypothetical protein
MADSIDIDTGSIISGESSIEKWAKIFSIWSFVSPVAKYILVLKQRASRILFRGNEESRFER